MKFLEKFPIKKYFVFALAVVVGYATLALLSTVIQEAWLGGVSYQQSSNRILTLAALFTPVAGLIAGFLTAAIAREATSGAITTLGCLIAAETIYLFGTGRVDGPFWFEAGSGAVLVAAVVLGAWIWRVTFPRTGPTISSPKLD